MTIPSRDIDKEEKIIEASGISSRDRTDLSATSEEKRDLPSNHEDSRPHSSLSQNGEQEGINVVEETTLTPDLERSQTGASAVPVFSVFTKNQKRYIIFMISCAGFFSSVSANIYFPALNALSRDLEVSQELINLTLTSYMIFQGLAPAFIGDLADMAGRRPALIICFTIYICANLGIALQDSYVALLILRCLQSAGSSGTIALGSGVVGDIATPSERGMYNGWATSGPMIAPAIGPIIGGILAQFLGWRSIFWFLVILAAVYMIPLLINYPETARKVVGNGSIPPRGWNMTLIECFQARKRARSNNTTVGASHHMSSEETQDTMAPKRKLRFPNPLNTLVLLKEKDVALLLIFNGLIFVAFYDVTASIPFLFQEIYGFNDLQIGLTFIPFGSGCMVAPFLNGFLLDWNFRRVAKQAGYTIDKKRGGSLKDFPLEKARVQVAAPMVFIGTAAILCYGWVVEHETSLAAPLILQFFVGLCLTGSFNAQSVWLIDLYPMAPATATAATNLVRCMMGAGGTAVIIIMLKSMGRGWCFTFVALVLTAFSPIYWVLYKKGPKWREERRVREELKNERYNNLNASIQV